MSANKLTDSLKQSFLLPTPEELTDMPKTPVMSIDTLNYLNSIDPAPAKDTFHLGKHKGKTFEEVAKTDPGYLRFLLTKCDSQHMKDDISRLFNWISLQTKCK